MPAAFLLCLALTAGDAAAVESTLARVRDEYDVPAMAAAVVDRDGLVGRAAVGARKTGGESITVDDRFALGSCTKSFTGTLIACLIEDGILAGDTTLADVLPDGVPNDRRRVPIHDDMRPVTVDDLLAHASGMAADPPTDTPAWLGYFIDPRPAPAVRRELVGNVQSQPPATGQGDFVYSNLGYVTLAAIAEEKTGRSYEELITERILKPLGMTSAAFRTTAAARRTDVWGHDSDGTPQDPTTAFADNPPAYSPAGTLHVSVGDWAQWAGWHLRGEPAPVLKTQSAYDRQHTPLTGPKLATGQPGPYGHGWIILDRPSGPAYTHGGSNTSFYALIWVLPDSDVACVVATNSPSFPACNAAAKDLLVQFAK